MIYEPLIVKGDEKKSTLTVIRLVTLIVCIASVVISTFMDNIVNIMYLGGLFYSTSVFFPLIIGMKWKRATAPAAIISILASVVIGVLSELVFTDAASEIFALPSNILSASTSIVVFVVVSFLTKAPDKEHLQFLEAE